MAGLVKTLVLVYFFCLLVHTRHGIAWHLPSPPSSIPSPYDDDTNKHGCPGSTAPFCGDSSSTTLLKCCDVMAHPAPPDFQAAVQYSGAISCADLTCQLCSAPWTGSPSRLLICAASSLSHHDSGAKGMSTATKIALLAGGIILVLGLTCYMNLRIIMASIMKMVSSSRSQQNINVKVESDARAQAASGAAALAVSEATALAQANANAQAILEARWFLVDGIWVLLDRQWRLVVGDGQGAPPLPDPLRTALPYHGSHIPVIEEITE